ncbi:4'-phosphopantetheinyl transferase superfamily protein [Yimella sp. cx-51]|uniref:4'-phosphopantetheinyl transferase family protein n=1 Tax=Yimella sp. cx-51 TaxID=2770551 RepID=UPI00165D9D24|nr:hypothetical protein [Yimella sp. cx-51]MBC9956477.1 hypothetical protein [Yimella sp. cx-51]QTH38410.1 hypothetical protein J5M86_01650 [Yimella sp. cx-51]
MAAPTAPLWRAAMSEQLLAADHGVSAVLNPDERARWSRLQRQTDRDDFVAARVLVRQLLVSAGVADDIAAIALAQKCAQCGGPHGRPSVVGHPEVFISWAHSNGRVAAAVSDRPLGIDIEPVDAGVPSLDGRARTVTEWVRLEALVKAGLTDLDGALHLVLDWPPSPDGRRFGDYLLINAHDGKTSGVIALAFASDHARDRHA